MLSLFDISYSATTDDGTLLQCRSSATPNRAKVLSYQSIQNEVGRTKVCFCSILKTVSMGPQWGKAPDLTAWFVTQCSPSPPLSYFIMPFQIYEATFRCFWTNRCPPTHTNCTDIWRVSQDHTRKLQAVTLSHTSKLALEGHKWKESNISTTELRF